MRRSWLCLAALPALALTACTDTTATGGADPTVRAPADARVIPPRPGSETGSAESAPPPPSPRPEGLVRLEPRRRAPAATDPVQPRPPVAPRHLIGMSEAELREAMGGPDAVRAEPPASVWHYDLEGCSIELFLFEDVASGRTKTLSYEMVLDEAAAARRDPRCAEAEKLADE